MLVGIPNITLHDRFEGYQAVVLHAAAQALAGVDYEILVSGPQSKPGIEGIVSAQNELIERALAGKFDYLWIIQADVEVPQGSFENLVGLGVDVAQGVVPRHDDINAFICGFMDEEKKVWYLPRQAVQGQILCGWVFAGMSCTLIKRRVLEAGISFRYLRGVGEDILFMFDVQKAGFEAKVDGRVVCGHLPEWPLPSNRRDDVPCNPEYGMLDVGCGHRPRGDVNVDLFPEASAHRSVDQRVNDDVGLHVHEIPNFVKADACHLPFRDCSFKSTYSWHLIEHLAEPEIFLQELMRVSSEVEVRCPNGEYLSCRGEMKPLHLHDFGLDWFRRKLANFHDWDFSFTLDYSQSEPWEIVVHGTRE